MTSQDTENGSVILADGTTMTADLIIGADGIHSSAVKEVIGYENPAVPTGISCFRCLMPVKEMLDDPECAHLIEAMEGKLRAFVSPKDGHMRIVWYPCREYVVPISYCGLGEIPRLQCLQFYLGIKYSTSYLCVLIESISNQLKAGLHRLFIRSIPISQFI
jgi:hypothetical protein